MVGFMPPFRCIYFLGERGWALCLFLDVYIFWGEGVGFMPLFRCIYFFIYFFLKSLALCLFLDVFFLFFIYFFLKV